MKVSESSDQGCAVKRLELVEFGRIDEPRDHLAHVVLFAQVCRNNAIEIKGVIEALVELSQHARMAIVTTAKRADFELIHEKRRIRQFMDFVLVREDYECAKPHPEPYLTGLKRFGAAKEETLVVEDSPRGLKSAVAAGIDCAIVRNDFTHSPDFSEASYRIEALIELRDIVAG